MVVVLILGVVVVVVRTFCHVLTRDLRAVTNSAYFSSLVNKTVLIVISRG